jgi:predicted site-specific integrase-resolvase
MTNFLPKKFVADTRYRVAVRTINRWVAAGALPPPVRIQGRDYFSEQQLDAHDAARLTPHKQEEATA